MFRGLLPGLALASGALGAACGHIGEPVDIGDVSGTGGPDDGDPAQSSSARPHDPVCKKGTSPGAVQAPAFVKHLEGQTSWFASPVIVDLDGDGHRELIAAYYSIYVFGSDGTLLSTADDGDGRVYAPHVVADLEGDGVMDIVAGNGRHVRAYEWKEQKLKPKAGWPVDTTTAGNAPEVRGLAAADLDGDGRIEIIATTTQTASTEDGGKQVFVLDADGASYQPSGLDFNAWPRYNAASGPGNDADRNQVGHQGYGTFGLNVGIGNIDDDSEQEILITYDNHAIQAFNHDGTAIDASPWFTNPRHDYKGERLTWGQFIRWADLPIEEDHYHLHVGEWPSPATSEWLQWTASPPNVVDIDGDGKNEVLGAPNIELHEPYETQAYALMLLEGAHGDGSRSAMRKPGWETLPRGGAPVLVDGYFPPLGVPAIATVDILGDSRPEIIVSLSDGHMRAFDSSGDELWSFSYRFGKAIMFASEPILADLNQDGSPEVLFTTYGAADVLDSGHLVILDAGGALLHDVPLENAGEMNGNGNGAAAAPTVGDLDGDEELEIIVQTFEHAMDVFTVPGSAENCLLWATARGGPLRTGQPNGL